MKPNQIKDILNFNFELIRKKIVFFFILDQPIFTISWRAYKSKNCILFP